MSLYHISRRFRGYLPVVVDVETAGFNPKTDALIEVAMQTVTMDDHGMLHPGTLQHCCIRPFPGSRIMDININFLKVDPFDERRNLQDENPALRPMFKEISKEVKAQLCTRAILVGHNAAFDLSFLKAAAERNNIKRFPFHQFSVLDTASLSALVYGQTVLSKACIAAGIEFDDSQAHGADYDTQKECELFCSIFNTFTKYAGFVISRNIEGPYDKKPQEQTAAIPEDQKPQSQLSEALQELFPGLAAGSKAGAGEEEQAQKDETAEAAAQ